jgi:hypothetical protein
MVPSAGMAENDPRRRSSAVSWALAQPRVQLHLDGSCPGRAFDVVADGVLVAAFSNTESPPSPGAGTFSAARRSWDGALQFRSGFA